jgi:hypothetical protein
LRKLRVKYDGIHKLAKEKEDQLEMIRVINSYGYIIPVCRKELRRLHRKNTKWNKTLVVLRLRQNKLDWNYYM